MRRIAHFVKKIPLWLPLVLPALLYLAVAVFWQSRVFYHITGDEVHYLLISDSLARDRDVLVANNYFADSPIQQASGVKLSDPQHFAHVYNQFSRHNIGLPFILALPYAVAGIGGAKIFMALLAGFWPLLFYRTLSRITGSPHGSALIAFALAIGLPFAAASNQIFPDLLAGMIILLVTEKIFAALENKNEQPSSLVSNLWTGALIGFLPWLHIRLTAPAIVLLLGYVAASVLKSRRAASLPARRQFLVPSAVVVCSILLLGAYNQLAFQNPLGPYASQDLTFQVKQVAMIFLGLHFDQSQGMFMQQPLLLVGLLGIWPLVKATRRGAFLLAVLYLSILLPNSMHTAWYGGFSFFGRFWWAASALWIFPLAYAFKFLLKRSELSVLLLCAGSIILQGWLAARWLFHDFFLLSSNLPIWATRSFYHDTGVSLRLPVFWDFDQYLKHPANYVFIFLGLLLVVTGWLWQRGAIRLSGKIWAASLALALSIFFFATPVVSSWTLAASSLNSHIGRLEGTSRIATGSDGAGLLIFGPYVALLRGDYEVALEYESDSPAARYGVFYGPESRLLAEAGLPPSATNNGLFKHRFTVREDLSLSPLFEFRVHYPGSGTLRVKRLTITPVSTDQ
jgi:hypothetical protein